MFGKIKLKWLAGLFALLLIMAVVITLRNRSNTTASKNRTFRSELVSFDSSRVTGIVIDPRWGDQPIELKKKGNDWKLITGESEYNADGQAVKGMINTLLSLRVKRIAATSSEQWQNFEVTDSLATGVKIVTDKKEVLNILIGKFSYQQPKDFNPYTYQQQGTMTSYVRLQGKKEVYAVDGMIAMSFNRQANDFRNRSLVRTENRNWDRIAITAKGESYVLVRQGEKWTLDGLVTDSTSTEQYISALSWLNSPNFVEENIRTSSQPAYTLKIEGESMSAPITIEAFPADSSHVYAITSSLNAGTFFSGKSGDLFEKIFKPESYFFTKTEK